MQSFKANSLKLCSSDRPVAVLPYLPAAFDRLLKTRRPQRQRNARLWRYYARNLEHFGVGVAGSDFNANHPISRAEIAEGVFQQNRPIAAYRRWPLPASSRRPPMTALGRFLPASAPLPVPLPHLSLGLCPMSTPALRRCLGPRRRRGTSDSGLARSRVGWRRR